MADISQQFRLSEVAKGWLAHGRSKGYSEKEDECVDLAFLTRGSRSITQDILCNSKLAVSFPEPGTRLCP